MIRVLQVQQVEIVLALVLTIGDGHIVAVFLRQVKVILLHAQCRHVFKLVRLWFPEYLLRSRSSQPVVVVSYPTALLIGIFGQDLADSRLNPI